MKKPAAEANLKTGWAKAVPADAAAASGPGSSAIHASPGFDWRSADAYLFDIDGTLLNSRDAVHYHAFCNGVRQVYGLSLDVSGVPIHGNTDVGILRGFLNKTGVAESEWLPKLPALVEAMCAEVERNAGDLRPELCPSIMELLQELHSRGKLLAVASGNLERIGWAKLEACGLKRFFSFGSFSDRHEMRDEIFANGIAEARRRLHPEAKVYVVGDTPADILSARANGAPVIALATGIYEVQELLPYSPDMCLSCCSDLLLRTAS